MPFEANTITCLVAKHLPTWAVLDTWADAFTVTIAVFEWWLTYSIMITLTPTSILTEDSWCKASYFPWAFALASAWIEILTTWTLAIDTLTFAFTWVECQATGTFRNFTSLASAGLPVKVIRPWACPGTAVDWTLNYLNKLKIAIILLSCINSFEQARLTITMAVRTIRPTMAFMLVTASIDIPFWISFCKTL